MRRAPNVITFVNRGKFAAIIPTQGLPSSVIISRITRHKRGALSSADDIKRWASSEVVPNQRKTSSLSQDTTATPAPPPPFKAEVADGPTGATATQRNGSGHGFARGSRQGSQSDTRSREEKEKTVVDGGAITFTARVLARANLLDMVRNPPKTTKEALAFNRAVLEARAKAVSPPRRPRETKLGMRAQSSSDEEDKPPIDMLETRTVSQQITFCAARHRWREVIDMWSEIEAKEASGESVKLEPLAYQNVMTAFLEQNEAGPSERFSVVFDHLIASGVEPRPVHFNLYMKGCGVLGLGGRAVALMKHIDHRHQDKVRRTPFFLYNLLMATVRARMVEESKIAYSMIKSLSFSGNMHVMSEYLDLLIEERYLYDATDVYHDMHIQGIKPRDPLVNKMTYACLRDTDIQIVHKLLDTMMLAKNTVQNATVKSIFHLAFRKMDSELVNKIWAVAQQWKYEFTALDYSFAVGTFIKSFHDQMALATLTQAHKAGVQVSDRTLDLMARRLSQSNGRLDDAYYTLAALQQSGEEVPLTAINAVIAGCAMRFSVDRTFSTAEALNDTFGLRPDINTFNAMMYAIAGTNEDQPGMNDRRTIGLSLLEKMDEEGVAPDRDIYYSLIELYCQTEYLSEDSLEQLVSRMAEKYDLLLDRELVDVIATAFRKRKMDAVARKWARRTIPRKGVRFVKVDSQQGGIQTPTRYSVVSGENRTGTFTWTRGLGGTTARNLRKNAREETSSDGRNSMYGNPHER